MDVLICIAWFALAGMRLYFHFGTGPEAGYRIKPENIDDGSQTPTPLQNAYLLLFAIQIIMVTIRMLTIFNTYTYFGKILKIIKRMFWETVQFLVMYMVYVVGFYCGIWFIIIANSDDDNLDYQPEGWWKTLLYTFQVFVGSQDITGVVDQEIAQIFVWVTTIFGTLILTNLLIALMTTKYEEVSEKAEAEVMLNQSERAYDLCNETPRLLPPPLTVLPMVFMFIAWWINLFVALLNPRWNVYAFVHHGTFERLKKVSWTGCCRREKPKASDGGDGGDGAKGEHSPGCSASTFFQEMKRREVLSWHCESIGFGKYQRIHHKNCYGYLIVHGKRSKDLRNFFTVDGIRMAEYIRRFEDKNLSKIHHEDRALLAQLSSDILFCRSCFKPFREDRVEDELVSPIVALMDLISAALLPIALLPLIIILVPLIIFERVMSWTEDDNDSTDD